MATLIDTFHPEKRLNESIKNANFLTKKGNGYKDSRLSITQKLLQYESWSPEIIDERQKQFCDLAEVIWPEELVS
jgi:hypothetical protein